MAGDPHDDLIQRLGALLAGHSVHGTVDDLRRLSGGASRETWACKVVDGSSERPLIVQRLRAGTVSGGPGMTGEAALLAAAGALGVPVPQVVAADDEAALGAPSIVMDRLAGEAIPRKLLRDDEFAVARTRLVDQVGGALAAIHRIDPAAAPSLRHDDQLHAMEQLLHGLGQPIPAFELALRWLAANRPPERAPGVVHGDFRLGNLLLDRTGLVGVLDWELAHLGDPAEDLGWYCVRAWRFGSPLAAGGTGTREALLAAYQAAGGASISSEALHWWELLGTVKWGLICVLQSQAHLSGAVRSVELAAIGRRVCENEWDALGLLPGPVLALPPPRPDPAGRDLAYGRPTVEELVEAVREWVATEVRSVGDHRVAFHGRVAENALGMVERELALGPAHADERVAVLTSLGCVDEGELANHIRDGRLDDRVPDVRSALAALVGARLEVANPAWLIGDAD